MPSESTQTIGFSPPTKVLVLYNSVREERLLIHLIYKHFILLGGNFLTMKIIICLSMVNTRDK